MRVLPNAAIVAGRNGTGTIECKVARTGWLKQCFVLSEDPAGLGFGAAALALSVFFKMNVPPDYTGDADVRIPVSWNVAGGQTVEHDVVVMPIWLAAPTRADVAAAYPAGMTGDGRVVFECQIDRRGGINACRPRLQDPSRGFINAARKLLPLFRLPNQAQGGASLEGARVFVPIQFLDPASRDLQDSPIGNRPIWSRTPDPGAIVFPAEARAKSIRSGKGVVDCAVSAERGDLVDCNIVSETPEGEGFGAAALAGTQHFGLSLWSFDGRPVEGSRITLPLNMVDDQSAAPATGD